jgi:DNA invertase Pin-like site-specific DNA recombinase
MRNLKRVVPQKAVGYLRVSTEEQASSGAGLDAQRAAITRIAEEEGLPISDWYEEAGISGSKGVTEGEHGVTLDASTRPQLVACIASLKKGDVLCVAKRDRLGRDRLLLLLIERSVRARGARLLSAAGEGTQGSDPSAIMLSAMVDMMAEHERSLIRQRTRDALRAKAIRGERIGGIPYGYDAHLGRLVENASEAVVLDAIRGIVRERQTSLRHICRTLDAAGLRSRSGAPWHPQTIARILARIHHE